MKAIPRTLRGVRWVPAGVGGLAFAWLGWRSELGLDLFSLACLGALGLLVLLGRGWWSPLLVFSTLLAPVFVHFVWTLPQAERTLSAVPAGALLRVEGVIRDRLPPAQPGTVSLLLGDVRWLPGDFPQGAAVLKLTELEVVFPAASAWPFRPPRRIRLGGAAARVEARPHRLRLVLSWADHHFQDEPPAWYSGEGWRIRLRDRGAYYLSRTAAAVYLPMVLDVRERSSPEGREVIGAFRRVGVSHLFAISGFNIALIFGLLMALQEFIVRRVQRGQGWVHARASARLVIIALIWAYILLIGSPAPAVRAALMGSVWIWSRTWGTRTPGAYVLTLAALAMLWPDPSLSYDISFQLSFLAYGFLALALDAGQRTGTADPAGAWRARIGRWSHLLRMNVWVTAVVTLGLWPLIAARFGNLSLLVFAGNLLLVPAMGAVILPISMLALLVSLAYVGAPPGAWLERVSFALVEGSLTLWLAVLRFLDRAGPALVFRVKLDWDGRTGFVYYTVLIGLLALLIRWRRRPPPGSFQTPKPINDLERIG